jgi:hypothetical protein
MDSKLCPGNSASQSVQAIQCSTPAPSNEACIQNVGVARIVSRVRSAEMLPFSSTKLYQSPHQVSPTHPNKVHTGSQVYSLSKRRRALTNHDAPSATTPVHRKAPRRQTPKSAVATFDSRACRIIVPSAAPPPPAASMYDVDAQDRQPASRANMASSHGHAVAVGALGLQPLDPSSSSPVGQLLLDLPAVFSPDRRRAPREAESTAVSSPHRWVHQVHAPDNSVDDVEIVGTGCA